MKTTLVILFTLALIIGQAQDVELRGGMTLRIDQVRRIETFYIPYDFLPIRPISPKDIEKGYFEYRDYRQVTTSQLQQLKTAMGTVVSSTSPSYPFDTRWALRLTTTSGTTTIYISVAKTNACINGAYFQLPPSLVTHLDAVYRHAQNP